MIENIKNQILKLEPFYLESFTKPFFSWKDLEKILNLRPFANDKRFITINLKKEYFWPNRAWLTDINSVPPNIIQEFIENYACYFADCSRVNYEINSLCEELETLTRKPVDAHIYFDRTEKENKSFSPHWDFAHNLIVQMEGQTNFKIWNSYCENENMERNVETMKTDPFIDVYLKPGDAVFVPAKMWHQALSQTKRLSISFPIWCKSNSIDDIQERHWIELN